MFKYYPSLKTRVPRVQLAELPTPIMHLKRLGDLIGTDSLYLKHDGLSGLELGGNKIRKLEFILGDALHKGAKEVVALGFAGSNHTLATAVCAQKLGLKSTLLLLSQLNAEYVRRNLLLSHVCGAEMFHFNDPMDAYIPLAIMLFRKKLKQGRIPYIIGLGKTSLLGMIGYVNAGFELKEQVANGIMPEPDKVFVPLGTMETAVGLTIGLKAAGLKTRVVSVRVAEEKYANKRAFAGLLKKTFALIFSLDPSFPRVEMSDDEIDIRHDFFGEQYARFTKQGMEAIDLLAKLEGIRLDGTYTGKAMAALIDYVKCHSAKNEIVLFWNTYNARDLSDKIKGIDYHRLPRSFHRYFEEGVEPNE